MDAYLLAASRLLMLSFFWIGLPTLLLTILLFHGFRSQSRYTFLIGTVGIAGLGCGLLGISLEGLVTGVSRDLHRFGTSDEIRLADDPKAYWTAITVWIALSTMCIAGSVWAFVRILKRPNRVGNGF